MDSLTIQNQPLDELGRRSAELQSEHIPQLLHNQDNADPRREPGDHRERDELDGRTETAQTKTDEDQSAEDGGEREADQRAGRWHR